MAETARPIESVEDIKSVCESPRASFEEYLECIHVAVANDRWDIVDDVAQRAIVSIGNRRVARLSIRAAAVALASATLQRASDLGDLEPSVEAAIGRLDDVLHSSAKRATAEVATVKEELAEIVTLLTDGEAASYVSLCSRLRRFDRPDLGRIAATKALDQDPRNAKALNTRGAAAVDMGDLRSALADLNGAWAIANDAHVATALSRAHAQADRREQALDWAERAYDMDPDSPAALHSLAAAAKLAGDKAAFVDAVERLEHLSPKQLGLFADSGQKWITCIAARNLLAAGDTETARGMINAILADDPDYSPARRVFHQINASLKANS